MPFLALTLDLPQGTDAERIEAACFEAGALSVTYSDRRDDAILEPAPGEFRLWPATRLEALFAADIASPSLVAELARTTGVPLAAIRARAVEDKIWEREWLADFHATRFGERLWVTPHHEAVSEPDAVVVKLDPGLAFGTGHHPTTALCLEWLDAHAKPGLLTIDYGCGSGILALAAVKLGARPAYAYDIDPQALIATRDNAARNGVAADIVACDTPALLPRDADLLLANILSGPLCELAPTFATLVRPGGRIVLAGLLSTQTEDVARAHAPWFDIAPFGTRDEWTCLAGVRNP